MTSLRDASTDELLDEMERRGGTLRAVALAQRLVLRKSEDYNRGAREPGAARDEYFPHGVLSHSQMIWTKAMRFRSLAGREGEARFEGLKDTALDLVNYASFFIDWRLREEEASRPIGEFTCCMDFAREMGGHPRDCPQGGEHEALLRKGLIRRLG